MKKRAIFMGTPDFGLPALRSFQDYVDVVAIYCAAPKPSKRGLHVEEHPVAQYAKQHGIILRTPLTLDLQEYNFLQSLAPDVCLVVSYGLLLPAEILEIFPLKVWNIHASLLPRWRGAAPIQRAIMAKDSFFGLSFMEVIPPLDAGDYSAQLSLPLPPTITYTEAYHSLAKHSGDFIHRILPDLLAGSLQPMTQDPAAVTYAKKILKSETALVWDQGGEDILAHIHGLSEIPGAWTMYQSKRLKILQASFRRAPHSFAPGQVMPDFSIACPNGFIHPSRLQQSGKNPLNLQNFLQGFPFQPYAMLQ